MQGMKDAIGHAVDETFRPIQEMAEGATTRIGQGMDEMVDRFYGREAPLRVTQQESMSFRREGGFAGGEAAIANISLALSGLLYIAKKPMSPIIVLLGLALPNLSVDAPRFPEPVLPPTAPFKAPCKYTFARLLCDSELSYTQTK